MTRTRRRRMVAAATLLVLAGCASRNELVHTHDDAGHIAGLFHGLWHGLIAPMSLVGSLAFDINIYDVHNTGFLYNLGFMIGIGLWFSAGQAILQLRHRRLCATRCPADCPEKSPRKPETGDLRRET